MPLRSGAAVTGLGGVLGGGALCALSEAVDGYGLIHDEESADDFPLAGPEQSYTVPDRQRNMRAQQQHLTVYKCYNTSKATFSRLFKDLLQEKTVCLVLFTCSKS